jgi:hypothetical protein
MTHLAGVSYYKGNSSGRAHPAPAPGTALADAYRRLRRGEAVSLPGGMRAQLVDFYGMELTDGRLARSGTRLVGEWDGPFFLTLEQVMAEEQARDAEACVPPCQRDRPLRPRPGAATRGARR